MQGDPKPLDRQREYPVRIGDQLLFGGYLCEIYPPQPGGVLGDFVVGSSPVSRKSSLVEDEAFNDLKTEKEVPKIESEAMSVVGEMKDFVPMEKYRPVCLFQSIMKRHPLIRMLRYRQIKHAL